MRSSTPARAFVCFVLFAAVGTAGGPARADVSTAPHRLPSQAQLDVLGRLIADTPDESPEKPDLIFRRALMYLECADYYAALPNPEAAVKAQQWRLAGVKALLALVDPPTYAAWPRMDEALFTLADQLTRVRKEEAARKYFKRLVTEHPRSRFVA
ncbi:MAG TPA: hypothetical protein VFF06_27630, partial [Polyangia bacterium]|nr:hypothetical protein [Polyangia bacterium]